MARIPVLRDDDADSAAAAALAEVVRNRGSASNFARTLAYLPDALGAFEQMSAAVRATPLDPALRELIVLRVTVLLGNEYEWRRHARGAAECGVSERQIRAIGSWREAECFDEITRSVLAMVDAHVRHYAVDEDVFAAVREQLGDASTVAVCLTVGWYLLIGAVMLPLRLADEDPMAPAAVARPPAAQEALPHAVDSVIRRQE